MTSGAPDAPPLDYDWATVYLVPHVHLGGGVPVGVVLHARRAHFLRARLLPPVEAAARTALDPALLDRFFEAYRRTVDADGAGALGRLPPSERFHSLTAPRSTVLQSGPVHTGRTRDCAATLGRLYDLHVGVGAERVV